VKAVGWMNTLEYDAWEKLLFPSLDAAFFSFTGGNRRKGKFPDSGHTVYGRHASLRVCVN
jgi:hypothetical protein